MNNFYEFTKIEVQSILTVVQRLKITTVNQGHLTNYFKNKQRIPKSLFLATKPAIGQMQNIFTQRQAKFNVQ